MIRRVVDAVGWDGTIGGDFGEIIEHLGRVERRRIAVYAVIQQKAPIGSRHQVAGTERIVLVKRKEVLPALPTHHGQAQAAE